MKKLYIAILLLFSSFCLAEINAQQKVNPMFKVDGIEIQRNSILRNANYNYVSYVESRGWGKKKRQAFAEAYGDIMTAINAGYVSERDAARRFIDTSGRIRNSNKRFDAYGEVARFINIIIDEMVRLAYDEQIRIQKENAQKEKMDDITRILKKNK